MRVGKVLTKNVHHSLYWPYAVEEQRLLSCCSTMQAMGDLTRGLETPRNALTGVCRCLKEGIAYVEAVERLLG